MQTTISTITISHQHEVTARVPSFLGIAYKFGYISWPHFFSALAIDSGGLETLEVLSFFLLDSFLVKMKLIYRKLIHRLNLF